MRTLTFKTNTLINLYSHFYKTLIIKCALLPLRLINLYSHLYKTLIIECAPYQFVFTLI